MGYGKRSDRSTFSFGLKQIGLLLSTTVGMLGGMAVQTPFHYTLIAIRENAGNDFVEESRGECVAADGESFWWWLTTLLILHFGFLVACSWVVYKIKDVPSRFNEGKYIAFSLANHFQVTLLALLLAFFISDKPDRLLLIKSVALLGSGSITLSLMFIPKVIVVHELVSRNSDLENAVKLGEEARSTTRAPMRTTARATTHRSLNSDDLPPSEREIAPRAPARATSVHPPLEVPSMLKEESSRRSQSSAICIRGCSHPQRALRLILPTILPRR